MVDPVVMIVRLVPVITLLIGVLALETSPLMIRRVMDGIRVAVESRLHTGRREGSVYHIPFLPEYVDVYSLRARPMGLTEVLTLLLLFKKYILAAIRCNVLWGVKTAVINSMNDLLRKLVSRRMHLQAV
jgi:hypothetical protein